MAAKERSNNPRAGRRKSNSVTPATGRESISQPAGGPHVDGRLDVREEDYRRSQIALTAYYHAERRGFGGNRELDDWLQAEREVNSRMDAAAAFRRSPKLPQASDTVRDRNRDLIEIDRLAAWARKLKVSTPRLREAIERVGPSLSVVKQYLENSAAGAPPPAS